MADKGVDVLLIVLWTGAGVLAAASLLALHYLVGLPYAPECPTCRGVTARPPRTTAVDRFLARCSGADARHCQRCGWRGRMRWRLAEERVRK